MPLDTYYFIYNNNTYSMHHIKSLIYPSYNNHSFYDRISFDINLTSQDHEYLYHCLLDLKVKSITFFLVG